MKTRKPHTIELSELQDWLLLNEALFASDGNGKKLTVTMSGGFKLYFNNEVVWQGMQPFTAVQQYNSY